MSESLNSLPVRTYVRSRVSTVIRNVEGISSGNIPLSLERPSDLTLIVVSDPMEGQPAFLAAAIGRVPTMMDFDIVLAPTVPEMVRPPHEVTLHVPAMESALYWVGFSPDGLPQSFGDGSIARLAVAIDQ